MNTLKYILWFQISPYCWFRFQKIKRCWIFQQKCEFHRQQIYETNFDTLFWPLHIFLLPVKISYCWVIGNLPPWPQLPVLNIFSFFTNKILKILSVLCMFAFIFLPTDMAMKFKCRYYKSKYIKCGIGECKNIDLPALSATRIMLCYSLFPGIKS